MTRDDLPDATEEEERALDAALDGLPRRPAPAGLRAAVELLGRDDRPASAHRHRSTWLLRARPLLLAAAAFVAVGAALFVALVQRPRGEGGDPLVHEAVNDHLRALYADRPIEIESGGIHQVKPWFEGRVDFAPTRVFDGDEEFPLEGGSVAYLVDRKAAAFFYRHKLHRITLFVFRADGLPWPSMNRPIGAIRANVASERGFHTIVWRDGDLGFALVSDVDAGELEKLAGKVADAR